jgi:hypothetical protein
MPPIAALSQKILFKVSARLTNSKVTKGIRAMVYANGAKSSAIYCVDKSQSVFYDGNNLMVKLFFENEGGCVKFLDNLNDDLTSFRFATNLNFMSPVIEPCLGNSQGQNHLRTLLWKWSDYQLFGGDGLRGCFSRPLLYGGEA